MTARLPLDPEADALSLVEAWHKIDHGDRAAEGCQEAAVIVPHMAAIEVALVLSKVLAQIRCSWDAPCEEPCCAGQGRGGFRAWFLSICSAGQGDGHG